MSNGNANYAVELGERVIAAMYDENSGLLYKRMGRISDRALEARFLAAEKPFEICDFKNQYGLCKLDKGHKGSHTVINLGSDE